MKAVSESYETRSMDELGLAALEILRRSPGLRCGSIGGYLFAGAHHRGSAPFARLAGRVMRRLEKSGRAVFIIENGWGGWYAC